MYKTISLLVISAALLAILLCSCQADISDEETTDNNEKIIAAIDKSSPVTKGNLITKTETADDGKIIIGYYDSNHNLVEKFVWNDDENIAHSVMQYSSTNKLQTKEELTPDGKTESIEAYQYDADENLIGKTVNEFENGMQKKSTVYDSDNKITGYSVSYYNDAELLTKIERFNSHNKLEEYYMYEYDSNGQTVKYSAYDSNSVLSKYTTFEYDDGGRMTIDRYFDSNNTLLSYNLYEYHESGNIKSVARYDSDGTVTDIDYFDDTD